MHKVHEGSRSPLLEGIGGPEDPLIPPPLRGVLQRGTPQVLGVHPEGCSTQRVQAPHPYMGVYPPREGVDLHVLVPRGYVLVVVVVPPVVYPLGIPLFGGS